MNFLLKFPGPFIVFLGACALSFGGLIVKSFEGSTLWQILFWRSFFFSIVVLLFLIFTYKNKIFSKVITIGTPGFVGGIILAGGYAGYVFAMYSTTVANANFIIQTQTIFLAIFGYIFLKEKISKLTLTSIFLAICGITLMLGGSLTTGQMIGNLAAFLMPISFAVLILIVRKFPEVDMIPLQLIAGLGAMILGYLFSSEIIGTIPFLSYVIVYRSFDVLMRDQINNFETIEILIQNYVHLVLTIFLMLEGFYSQLWMQKIHNKI